MLLEIELEPIPDQTVTVIILGVKYEIQVKTRRGKLYMCLWIDGVCKLINRVLLDMAPATENLIMVDTMGNATPVFEGLGTRFKLVWSNE